MQFFAFCYEMKKTLKPLDSRLASGYFVMLKDFGLCQ